MEKILAQALAYTANTAVGTVIYALFAVIVPELADFAKVLCSLLVAFLTKSSGRLWVSTNHA